MPINQINGTQLLWFDAIRDSLTRDLLSKKWRKMCPPNAHRVCGHCYKATEAAYYAFGRQAGFEPHVFCFGKGVTHWWLARPHNTHVIDLTYEQIPAGFDYTLGCRKFMRLGKGPGGISRLGGILLERARAKVENASNTEAL
jgi:hypothetical protein